MFYYSSTFCTKPKQGYIESDQVYTLKCFRFGLVLFMAFNATFNNISVILWWSALSVEEFTEKTTDLSQVTDKLYHIMLYRPQCCDALQSAQYDVKILFHVHFYLIISVNIGLN